MTDLLGTVDGMPGRALPCCSWPPARPFPVARHSTTVATERQALTSASLPLPRQRFSTTCLMGSVFLWGEHAPERARSGDSGRLTLH
jgi:hypothetical protein